MRVRVRENLPAVESAPRSCMPWTDRRLYFKYIDGSLNPSLKQAGTLILQDVHYPSGTID